MSERSIELTAAEAGQRLDRYLRKLLRHVPLGAIMKQLRSGRIRVDGHKAKPELRLEAGMVVLLQLPAADLDAVDAGGLRRDQAGGPEPDFALRIEYADDDMMVVQKPSGLAVHAGSGHERRSVVAWLDASGRGVRTATFAPSPAHRLDRETSGLLAIGLSPAGLGGLTAAFRDDLVRKVYFAVVAAEPVPARGTIDAPLLAVASASASEPKVRVDAGGRSARTDYETVAAGGRFALLRLVLHTGRTHQIRAHLAHIGHPVVGDRRYGRIDGRGSRLMLHAGELALPHPVTGAPLRFAMPTPREFKELVGR
ncbi:MAG: RluA family pseudouridine synthase [Planctomycetes bacterium]|nr:RluA family pseudouridine synthase [Planctomycetota bacterium]